MADNFCLNHCDDIARFSQDQLQGLDFRYFSHSRTFPNGQYYIMTSESLWPKHHFDDQDLPPAGFLNFDSIQSQLLLPCMDMGYGCGLSDDYMSDSFKRFNITRPAMFNIKTDDYLDSYFIDLQHPDAYTLYVNHSDFFVRFFERFRERFDDLIMQAAKNPMKIDVDAIRSRQIHVSSNDTCVGFNMESNEMPVQLSDREWRCLSYIARGYSIKTMARLMKISPRTVETYIRRIRQKTKLHLRKDLIDFYWKNNLKPFFN